MLEKKAYFGATEREEINTAVRLNRRVTFDRRFEVPSPSFSLKKK